MPITSITPHPIHGTRLALLALLAMPLGSALTAAESEAPRLTATATSFQAKVGNEPDKAIDGDGGSIWHSQWDPYLPLPQSLTLDQGTVGPVASLSYLPRAGAGNGTISSYNIAVSTDGTTFTQVVGKGSWAVNGKRKAVNFPAVQARYVRLEALAGVGNFASAAEVSISATPIDPTYEPGKVAVLSPAYGAEITGTTTISVIAPGLSSAVVSCWKQGPGFGSDTIIGTIALDAQAKGTIAFPAGEFPHGPLCVVIAGAGGAGKDNCYLQLFNQGGAAVNEGLPKDPPAAAGMTLVWADDFDKAPSISGADAKGIYYDHKPPDGSQDFSTLRFTGYHDANNPFAQVGTYLRIRADENKNSAGLISSLKHDGTGITVSAPCYFECRFIAPNAVGTWPAFWLLTDLKGKDAFCDELDIIEGYGGEGHGSPNAFDAYCVTPHAWNQGKAGHDAEQAALKQFNGPVVKMARIGIPSTWYQTFHVYGCKITETDTIYYCDDREICRHQTLEVSKKAPFYFLINLATGGGWPVDLSRYNGVADMYVDYVRVYSANQADIDKLPKK